MKRSKKLVLLICEGQTDENALYYIMKAFFNHNEIKFHIAHGDPILTHDKEKGSVMDDVRDIVRMEMKRYALKKSDILAVFQITDTDGVFISNENIVENPEAQKIVYHCDHIETAYVSSIKARNHKKRKNMNILSEERSINDETPYRLYYMSRNLEHALYGKEESMNDSRKTSLADSFSSRFNKDWEAFLYYIENEGQPLGENFQQSWDEIRKETRSLERHTNINLLFREFGYLHAPENL